MYTINDGQNIDTRKNEYFGALKSNSHRTKTLKPPSAQNFGVDRRPYSSNKCKLRGGGEGDGKGEGRGKGRSTY